MRHENNKALSAEWINQAIVAGFKADGCSGLEKLYRSFLDGAQCVMLSGKGVDYFIETPELADLISGVVKDFTADVIDVIFGSG